MTFGEMSGKVPSMNLFRVTLKTERTFLVEADSHQAALLLGDEVGHQVEDSVYTHSATPLKMVDPANPDDEVWMGGSHGHWFTLAEYGAKRHI